jgi:hypothetical protein
MHTRLFRVREYSVDTFILHNSHARELYQLHPYTVIVCIATSCVQYTTTLCIEEFSIVIRLYTGNTHGKVHTPA